MWCCCLCLGLASYHAHKGQASMYSHPSACHCWLALSTARHDCHWLRMVYPIRRRGRSRIVVLSTHRARSFSATELLAGNSNDHTTGPSFVCNAGRPNRRQRRPATYDSGSSSWLMQMRMLNLGCNIFTYEARSVPFRCFALHRRFVP